MSEQQAAPGPDEIALAAPAPGELCSSLEHHRAGCPAQVVVTLGPMGTAGQHRQALWLETWGKPYPMCVPCWQATRQVAQAHRPGLVITDTRTPAGWRVPAP
jgi:hypothetical protein